MKGIHIFHSPALFLMSWHVAGTTTGSQRHSQPKCLKVLHQTKKAYLFFQNGVQTAEYKHLHRTHLCLTPFIYAPDSPPHEPWQDLRRGGQVTTGRGHSQLCQHRVKQGGQQAVAQQAVPSGSTIASRAW